MASRLISVHKPVPSGWRIVRLGVLATMNQGGTPRKNRPEYWDGPIPFLTGADLTEVRIGQRNARSFLTAEGLHSGDTVVCEPGALLLATRTAVGLAGIATETMGASQDITCLVTNDQVDAGYLCRSLLQLAPSLHRKSRGTTIQGITREDVTSLPILLPPLSEQQAIAAVLDSIDEAIERTDAVITATEKLRGALLNELLKRGVPGWHTEWKEAPGIGTIPASWKVVRLADVAEVAFSSVDKKTLDDEIPVELCNYTDVFYNRRIRLGMKFMSATASLGERDRWALRRGDVLFTKDSETPEEIGIPAYVTVDMPVVLCGYHLGLARPREGRMDGAYLAELLRSPGAAGQFARIANGVTRFGLTLAATNSIAIALPSLSEQQLIATMLESVDDAIDRMDGERDGLQSLKASAADALLTGRVRVEV